jgi:hypothetical protein
MYTIRGMRGVVIMNECEFAGGGSYCRMLNIALNIIKIIKNGGKP